MSSAKAARAVMHCFKTALVSRSALGGKRGKALYGWPGFQFAPLMFAFFAFFDTLAVYVDPIDMSTTCVDFFLFHRHKTALLEQFGKVALFALFDNAEPGAAEEPLAAEKGLRSATTRSRV
ncbi:MAG: hypothetical protein AB1456_08035 [Thermodesulfobacteriota bacterium]